MASTNPSPTDSIEPTAPGGPAAGSLPAGAARTDAASCSFEVVLADGIRECIEGADAYQQEQSMTTFFRTDGPRQTVDCWSVRVASFRTEHIVAVRRREAAGEVRHLHPV